MEIKRAFFFRFSFILTRASDQKHGQAVETEGQTFLSIEISVYSLCIQVLTARFIDR